MRRRKNSMEEEKNVDEMKFEEVEGVCENGNY